MNKISDSGYRFPPEMIQQAIWLYLRFTLRLRDVEDLSAERVNCRERGMHSNSPSQVRTRVSRRRRLCSDAKFYHRTIVRQKTSIKRN